MADNNNTDRINQQLDAELRKQRRLITMLLNRDRIRNKQNQNNSNNNSNPKADKYQKEIDKSSKKIAKLMEEEIKLNKEVSKVSKELRAIAKKEIELQELANRIQNEANRLSDAELDILQKEYDTLFEQLSIDKDNLLINQRSLQEDLKYNREEQKRHEKIVNNAEKLQKELEDVHETMEDMGDSLDSLSGKFDGLTEMITAWNIADIKNSLEEDAASSKDLYRELANKMGKDIDTVIAEVKPYFKEQQKMYNDVFTSTEYLQALNDIWDTGKHSLEEARIMAGTMSAMDKVLNVSADSMDSIYTWFNSSQLNTLADNLAGIKDTMVDLEIDNINFDELTQSINDLAPKLADKDQSFQDQVLANLSTLQAYSVDTGAFTENLNTLMSSSLGRGQLIEDYGAYSVDLAEAVKSGNTELFQKEMDRMIQTVQNSQNHKQIEAWYGGLVDETMYEQIKSGNFTQEDYQQMLASIQEGMGQGSLEKSTQQIYDNMKAWDKFYNKFISGSWVEDLAQSDLWENFGFLFQLLGAKLLEKVGSSLWTGLTSGTLGTTISNAFSNALSGFSSGTLGTTITNSLSTAWNWFVNLIKTPFDDIAASIGTGGSIVSTIGTISGYIAEILAFLAVFKSGKDLWNMVTSKDDKEFAEAAEKSWGGKALSWLENKLVGTDRLQAMFDAVKKGDTKLKEVKYIDENGEVAYRYESSHAGGLSYVPYDGYNATLHKGERVLTSEEAKRYGLSEDMHHIMKSIWQEMIRWHDDTDKSAVKARSQYNQFNQNGTTFTNPSGTASGGTFGGGNGILSTLKDKATELVEKLKETAKGLSWDQVKDKASEMWNTVKGTLSETWDSAKDTVQQMWNNLVDGSHANGLANVPYNGYVAELHEGERVLTANENARYSAMEANAANSAKLLSKISDAGVIEQATRLADSYKNAVTAANTPPAGTIGTDGTVMNGAVSTPGGPVDETLMFSGTEGFFQALGPSAKEGERQYNVFAATTLAQAALESGWGKSRVAKTDKNLFGIKWTGRYAPGLVVTQGLNCPSNEQGGARPYNRYQSYGDSMTDHAWFLANNKRYAQALQANNAKDQVKLIAAAGYAESNGYADSLIKMIDKYNLTQYKQGTPFVPNDQVAFLHKGEMVVPADLNPYNTNTSATSINNDDVVEAIGELKAVIKQAVDYIGRKMDNAKTVEVKQPTKVTNTLNERFKQRQLSKTDLF